MDKGEMILMNDLAMVFENVIGKVHKKYDLKIQIILAIKKKTVAQSNLKLKLFFRELLCAASVKMVVEIEI